MKNPKFRGVRHAILEAEVVEDWLNQESVHRGFGTLCALLSTVSSHLPHVHTFGNTIIFIDPKSPQAQNM